MSISLSLHFLLKSLAPLTKTFRVVKRVVKLIGFQSFVFLILQSLYPSRKLSIIMEKHDFIYEIHPLLGWHQISEDDKVNFPFWLQLHSFSIPFIANAPVFHLYKSLNSLSFPSKHIHMSVRCLLCCRFYLHLKLFYLNQFLREYVIRITILSLAIVYNFCVSNKNMCVYF